MREAESVMSCDWQQSEGRGAEGEGRAGERVGCLVIHRRRGGEEREREREWGGEGRGGGENRQGVGREWAEGVREGKIEEERKGRIRYLTSGKPFFGASPPKFRPARLIETMSSPSAEASGCPVTACSRRPVPADADAGEARAKARRAARLHLP